jgi:hypothetical protein
MLQLLRPPAYRVTFILFQPRHFHLTGKTESHYTLNRFEDDAEFEVPTAVVKKVSSFWDVTPCDPLKELSLP